MNRLFVLSVLSLGLAGCTQSSGALLRGASYPPSPLALAPAPAGGDAVTRTGTSAGMSRSAISSSAGSDVSVPLVAQVTK